MVLVTLFFSRQILAQREKIPTNPFQIIDVSTSNEVPEALVIPRYSTASGIVVLPPEGRLIAKRKVSFKRPFIYKSGNPFVVDSPKAFIGLPLIFAYVGKFKDIGGVVIIALGYYPLWTDDLWDSNADRKKQFRLKPVSKAEWDSILKDKLTPLYEKGLLIEKNCDSWGLEDNCNARIDFRKGEMEMVRSFLLRPLENK